MHERPNKRWHSYSIASWPDGSNIFELVIVLDKDGAGTYICSMMCRWALMCKRTSQECFYIEKNPSRKTFSGLYWNRYCSIQEVWCIISATKKFNTIIYTSYSVAVPKTLYYASMNWMNCNSKCRTFIIYLLYREKHGKEKPAMCMEFMNRLLDVRPTSTCGWKGMIDEAAKESSTSVMIERCACRNLRLGGYDCWFAS